MNFLSLAGAALLSTVTLNAAEGKLMKELTRSFGAVEWVTNDGSLALQVIGGISFAQGSSEISRDGTGVLDRLGRELIRNPQMVVDLVGWSAGGSGKDRAGRLGSDRAGMVKNYLVAKIGLLCESARKPVGCGDIERKVIIRKDLGGVSAMVGRAEGMRSERVDLYLRFR